MFQAVDWQNTFVPAVWNLLNGRPLTPTFFNPVWALFPLIPMGVLPYEVGRVLLLAVALASYCVIVRKLGGSLLAFAVFALTIPAFDSLAWGNIEWLALLGLAMPQPLGLIFLAIKPQATVGIIVYWLVMALRDEGTKGALHLLIPVALVSVVSVLLFGPWFVQTLTYSPAATFNFSLFPYSVPIGLALIAVSLYYKNVLYAVAASPCFFPVVSPQVWLVVFLALVPSLPKLTLSSVGVWALYLIR